MKDECLGNQESTGKRFLPAMGGKTLNPISPRHWAEFIVRRVIEVATCLGSFSIVWRTLSGGWPLG